MECVAQRDPVDDAEKLLAVLLTGVAGVAIPAGFCTEAPVASELPFYPRLQNSGATLHPFSLGAGATAILPDASAILLDASATAAREAAVAADGVVFYSGVDCLLAAAQMRPGHDAPPEGLHPAPDGGAASSEVGGQVQPEAPFQPRLGEGDGDGDGEDDDDGDEAICGMCNRVWGCESGWRCVECGSRFHHVCSSAFTKVQAGDGVVYYCDMCHPNAPSLFIALVPARREPGVWFEWQRSGSPEQLPDMDLIAGAARELIDCQREEEAVENVLPSVTPLILLLGLPDDHSLHVRVVAAVHARLAESVHVFTRRLDCEHAMFERGFLCPPLPRSVVKVEHIIVRRSSLARDASAGGALDTPPRHLVLKMLRLRRKIWYDDGSYYTEDAFPSVQGLALRRHTGHRPWPIFYCLRGGFVQRSRQRCASIAFGADEMAVLLHVDDLKTTYELAFPYTALATCRYEEDTGELFFIFRGELDDFLRANAAAGTICHAGMELLRTVFRSRERPVEEMLGCRVIGADEPMPCAAHSDVLRQGDDVRADPPHHSLRYFTLQYGFFVCGVKSSVRGQCHRRMCLLT